MLNKPFITEDVSYKNIKISRKVNVSCKDHNEQAFKNSMKEWELFIKFIENLG